MSEMIQDLTDSDDRCCSTCPGCGQPWSVHPHTTDGQYAEFPEDHPEAQ